MATVGYWINRENNNVYYGNSSFKVVIFFKGGLFMLTEKAKKIAKETNNIMDMIIQDELCPSRIACMDSDDFEKMKLFVTMAYNMCEYMVEEAKVLDEIKRKLETR